MPSENKRRRGSKLRALNPDSASWPLNGTMRAERPDDDRLELAHVAHPDWCDEERCTLRPGNGGTHQSVELMVGSRRIGDALYTVSIFESFNGVPVIELAKNANDGEEPVCVNFRLADARAVGAILTLAVLAVEGDVDRFCGPALDRLGPLLLPRCGLGR